MPAQTTNARLRWVVCGLLFLVTTINYIDRSALWLVEPILKHMLGAMRILRCITSITAASSPASL